ncbi:MAG: hypothetical protein N2053_09660, partial [Chitinispirillaceae bacterium]|nr:hypothetical protein [Chitinispirillaceae bacterium]
MRIYGRKYKKSKNVCRGMLFYLVLFISFVLVNGQSSEMSQEEIDYYIGIGIQPILVPEQEGTLQE